MPKTLLLADDSVTIQKVVAISFSNEDLELVTVDNGTDAVARAREIVPDIVLADVVMPGMSGYEVCEAIKSDPTLSGISVLLLTGTFEAFDEARAQQVGADGHITKPFEAQALVDAVNAHLSSAPSGPTNDAATSSSAPASSEAGADETYDFLEDEFTEPREALADATAVFLGEDALALDAPDAPDREQTLPPALAEPVSALPEAALDLEGETSLLEEVAPGNEATLFADAPSEPGESAASGPRLLAWEDSPALDDSFSDLLGAADASEDPLLAAADTSDDPLLAAADGSDDPLLATADGSDDPLLGDPFEARTPHPEEGLSTSVGPEDLASESVLDPAGGRDYDVSSSDLGDPLDPTPTPNAPTGTPVAPAEAQETLGAPSAADPMDDLVASAEPVSLGELATELPGPEGSVTDPEPFAIEAGEPLDAEAGVPLEAEPADPFAASEPPGTPEPLAWGLAAAPGPTGDTSPDLERPFGARPAVLHDASAEATAEPLAMAGPEPSLTAPEPAFVASDAGELAPIPGAGPELEVQRVSETEPVEAAPFAGLSGTAQQELHDALERIAWEAFSEVSERIVKNALERIESVAWEVIPQMAEALISEEIRKLKGDS